MINISKIYRIGDVNMPSRMDRYDSENIDVGSRTNKNQQLYKELYSNKTYTEFTDAVGDNVVEINNANINTTNTRSNFRKTRLYYGNENNELDSSNLRKINNLYKDILNNDIENKSYDINDIMEDAKRNRQDEDEEDKQKKIKSAEYSILNDLSKEKIKQFQDKKQKGITREEEENLEDLINTITSNSLRKKIDNQLLSDLLPEEGEKTSTRLLEELAEGIPDEIDDDTKEQMDDTEDLSKGIDRSFFTRSMDLRKEDLILGDQDEEIDDSFKEKSGVLKKIVIALLIIAILAIIGYILYLVVAAE